MTALGKWGTFLQPSLKWSLLHLENCVGTQRTEEVMVVVRRNHRAAKQWGPRAAQRGRSVGRGWVMGLVQSAGHRGFGVIFKLRSAVDEALCELRLCGASFLLYSHSTCCSRQPVPQ